MYVQCDKARNMFGIKIKFSERTPLTLPAPSPTVPTWTKARSCARSPAR